MCKFYIFIIILYKYIMWKYNINIYNILINISTYIYVCKYVRIYMYVCIS